MLIYLKKNAYWQDKQVLSLTYYYNYGILVLNSEESKHVSITKIILQILFYMYKNRINFGAS
jgi:hypothetical protein